MRICFFAHASSANTRSWANHLADVLGHDVHVVSLCHSDGLGRGVTLHVVPSRCAGILAYATALPEARRLVRAIAPDILVGYRIASYGFLAAATGFHPLALAAQGRVVTTPLAPLKRLLVSYAMPRADIINSWASHMTLRLTELGADPDKILTTPRGIDLGLFRPGPPDDERTDTVVVTRTMHRAYRHDVVLRAVAAASREVPGLRCVFAGEGEAMNDLRALAAKLGIANRVEFAGEVTPDRLVGMLSGARVYTSSVRTDGVSASLLEAMACGAFPVVTDNEANRLWLDEGVNGILVQAVDPSAYAAAIVGVLRNREMRESAAVRNREIVESSADLDKNMRVIERAYAELVRAAAGGSV